MSNGQVIYFMGIRPEAGLHYTVNRHHCDGKAQVQIRVDKDGGASTFCPTCGARPTVLYEAGTFYCPPVGAVII